MRGDPLRDRLREHWRNLLLCLGSVPPNTPATAAGNVHNPFTATEVCLGNAIVHVGDLLLCTQHEMDAHIVRFARDCMAQTCPSNASTAAVLMSRDGHMQVCVWNYKPRALL